MRKARADQSAPDDERGQGSAAIIPGLQLNGTTAPRIIGPAPFPAPPVAIDQPARVE